MFRHHLGALAMLAAFALPLAASAQIAPGPPPPGPAVAAPMAPPHHMHRGHRSPYLHALRTLNLSDAQKQQIGGYVKSSRDAQRQARVASERALRAQIDAVLTPDQRAQMRTAMVHSRRFPQGAAMPGTRPAQ